jgi:hypothetical protein
VACQQHRQDLKGLFLKSDSHSVLAQFARTQIQLKDSKPEGLGRMLGSLH